MKNLSIAIVVVCMLSFCLSGVALAKQREIPPTQAGSGGFWDSGSNLRMLGSEKVQNEIEISDEQKTNLATIRDGMAGMIREKFDGLRGMDRELLQQRLAEMKEKIDQEIQEQVNEVLSEEQLKRIEQLQAQKELVRFGGIAFGLHGYDEMLKELGIDDDMKTELSVKAIEVRQELAQKIKELREAAREEVLSVLTDEQRKAFQDKVGEEFEFDPEPRRRMVGGGAFGGRVR